MSAFIVSKRHIDVLVQAARTATAGAEQGLSWGNGQRRQFPELPADELGRMLWRENLKSLQARYPKDRDGHRPGPHGFRDGDVEAYRFESLPTRPTLVHLVHLFKAIDGYEYQSCEHDGWAESEAHEFCEVLRQRLITKLPGYEDSPLEW